MAAVAPPTTLSDAFKKVVGQEAGTGVTPPGGAVYATPAGARPGGDVINISQAPGLAYTPAEQWAHEAELRNYELNKQKFDLDKVQQQQANQMGALQLQAAIRASQGWGDGGGGYGGGGGGGGYGGGGYRRSSYRQPSYMQGWNTGGDYRVPTQYTTGQGNVTAQLRPLDGGPRQLLAPPGMSGPRLGTWADQQIGQAIREGRAPPQIIQDIRY